MSPMQEMFAKAANPHRVFAGSVQQIYEFHEACWHTGLPWGDHIRSITVPFSDAKGPTNARHMAASLYRGEDYFMQIDSHTSFIQVTGLTVHIILASQSIGSGICTLTSTTFDMQLTADA